MPPPHTQISDPGCRQTSAVSPLFSYCVGANENHPFRHTFDLGDLVNRQPGNLRRHEFERVEKPPYSGKRNQYTLNHRIRICSEVFGVMKNNP